MRGCKRLGSIVMENTHARTHTYTVERNMGVVRKRKANKYLLTQQKLRRVGHWWKQKAEDEERRARKPVGRGPCAPLVLEWKTKGRRRRDGSGEDGMEGRREGPCHLNTFSSSFCRTSCIFRILKTIAVSKYASKRQSEPLKVSQHIQTACNP